MSVAVIRFFSGVEDLGCGGRENDLIDSGNFGSHIFYAGLFLKNGTPLLFSLALRPFWAPPFHAPISYPTPSYQETLLPVPSSFPLTKKVSFPSNSFARPFLSI